MIKDYSYEYEYDSFYCYPGLNVLKNKLYIKDTALLAEAERKITGLRTIEAQQKRICGRFDFNHLKQIRKFLFGDIYEWAGKIRSVNISKGNQFCRVEFMNIGSEDMLLASVKAFDLDYTLLENLLDGAMEKKKQK